MFAYAFLFNLLALTACIGAGYVLWTMVLQKITFRKYVGICPSSAMLGMIGLFAFGILAIVVNFLAPVSQWLSAFVISIFLVSGIVSFTKVSRTSLLDLLIITTVVALFSFWGAKFMLSFDAGLYHLQAISWMKDEPVVFGLANLHERFGFNSLLFSSLAIFWLPHYEVKGVLLASYLPAMLAFLILINHLLNIPRLRPLNLTNSTLFALFSIASLSAIPSLMLTLTTSTDLAPNTLTILSAFMFLRAVENCEAPADEVFKDHIILWVIALFAILTKLSAITPGLLALFYSLRYSNIMGIIVIRRTLYFLSVVTAVWLLRNFILSGCFIYPIGFTCADTNFVPWSVGSDSAELMRAIIEWWAKVPRVDFHTSSMSQEWFVDWLRTPARGGQLVRIGLGILGLPVVVLLYLSYLLVKNKRAAGERKDFVFSTLAGPAWVSLAAMLGLLFGFLTVPDPRFWWGSLITLTMMLPVTILSYLYSRSGTSIDSRSASPVILCSLILIGNYALLADPTPTIVFNSENSSMVIPELQTEMIQNEGFVTRVPIEGNMCWLAPKPCSPTRPSGLSLDHIGHYLVFTKNDKKILVD